MPGSSLWLVPPPDSALYASIQHLIATSLPEIYSPLTNTPPVFFTPHLTLAGDTAYRNTAPTDEIPDSEAQAWLDSVVFPTKDVTLFVSQVQMGEPFFRKVTLKATKVPALNELAAHARAAGQGEAELKIAREWVASKEFAPHVSLVYADMDLAIARQAFGDVMDAANQVNEECVGAGSTRGAEVWLVPTHKPVDEWKPIARRKLENVEWAWGRC